jgi:hypothetical protein
MSIVAPDRIAIRGALQLDSAVCLSWQHLPQRVALPQLLLFLDASFSSDGQRDARKMDAAHKQLIGRFGNEQCIPLVEHQYLPFFQNKEPCI